MILNYYIGPKSSVMTDLYKTILNNMDNKEKYLIISPESSEIYWKSKGYKNIITEDCTENGNLSLNKRLFKFIKKVYRICKEKGCKNIFILCENNWSIVLLYPMIKLLNLNIYIWIHDPELHSGERLKIRIARKLTDFFIIRNSKKIIVSYSQAKNLVKRKYNIDDNKISVIYLPELTNMQFSDLKNKNIENVYDCIFYGRIEEYKGIDILIEAINILVNNYNRTISIAIVGRGQKSSYIKDLINKYNLDSNIKFYNEYVEDYKLASLICQSKIVILPYRDATGTQTIQIANYYNKPVIANDVGAFSDYIRENVNGVLIREISAEKLASETTVLLDDEEKYEKIIKGIDEFYNENFRIEQFIHKLKNNVLK